MKKKDMYDRWKEDQAKSADFTLGFLLTFIAITAIFTWNFFYLLAKVGTFLYFAIVIAESAAVIWFFFKFLPKIIKRQLKNEK